MSELRTPSDGSAPPPPSEPGDSREGELQGDTGGQESRATGAESTGTEGEQRSDDDEGDDGTASFGENAPQQPLAKPAKADARDLQSAEDRLPEQSTGNPGPSDPAQRGATVAVPEPAPEPEPGLKPEPDRGLDSEAEPAPGPDPVQAPESKPRLPGPDHGQPAAEAARGSEPELASTSGAQSERKPDGEVTQDAPDSTPRVDPSGEEQPAGSVRRELAAPSDAVGAGSLPDAQRDGRAEQVSGPDGLAPTAADEGGAASGDVAKPGDDVAEATGVRVEGGSEGSEVAEAVDHSPDGGSDAATAVDGSALEDAREEGDPLPDSSMEPDVEHPDTDADQGEKSEASDPEVTAADDSGVTVPVVEAPETDGLSEAMAELQEQHPVVASVVDKLLNDRANNLNFTEALRDPGKMEQAMAITKELADGGVLGERGTLEDYRTQNPGAGPLFDPVDRNVNELDDGTKRKDAFVRHAKEVDGARALGGSISDVERQGLEEYGNRLEGPVKSAVKDDVSALLQSVPGLQPDMSIRVKHVDGQLEKVGRANDGYSGRPPNPDYKVGDVIDAVGARLTVDDMQQLESLVEGAKEYFGVGDGGRLLEMENMYAQPKGVIPAIEWFRCLPRSRWTEFRTRTSCN